jgi:hypothetical protein
MKKFKNVIIVKHPKTPVWKTMRDRLPEMVPYLDNVASITQVQRQPGKAGSVQLVNLWKADVKIPAAIQSIIDVPNLSWLDRAEWLESRSECRWSIEPQFLPGSIRCAGSTHFEPALGGGGTRITFEGELEVSADRISGLPGFAQTAASHVMEALVISLVPKNFRKITDAISILLERKSPERAVPRAAGPSTRRN